MELDLKPLTYSSHYNYHLKPCLFAVVAVIQSTHSILLDHHQEDKMDAVQRMGHILRHSHSIPRCDSLHKERVS